MSSTTSQSRERDRRVREAIAFVYRVTPTGELLQRSEFRVPILAELQPGRNSVFTYDDVDSVYALAAAETVDRYAEGKLRLGLTRSYTKLTFGGRAVDHRRRELKRRIGHVSLDTPLGDGEDSGTVADVVAGPEPYEPHQQALLTLLNEALNEVVAELPRQQLTAFQLRDQCDFETDHVDPTLIDAILDATDGISNTAHTTAYHAAKRSIQRKLVEKFGVESLNEILNELGIALELDEGLAAV